jgi:hypothetical protein
MHLIDQHSHGRAVQYVLLRLLDSMLGNLKNVMRGDINMYDNVHMGKAFLLRWYNSAALIKLLGLGYQFIAIMHW